MSSWLKFNLAAVLGAVLVVSGCGAADEPSTAGGAPTPPVATTRTPASAAPSQAPTTRPTVPRSTAAATPTGPVRLTKGMTRPGTRLRFGQRAIVPVRHYNSFSRTYFEGVISITVEPIRRTAASKIEGNFDEKSRALLKGRTAYYARVVITNVAGTSLSVPTPTLKAYRSGRRHSEIALIGGELPECPEPSAPESFHRKGGRWVTCALAVSSAASPIRSFEFDDPPYGTEAKVFPDDPEPRYNEYYNLGPISWR
jgi:hypothetical protein